MLYCIFNAIYTRLWLVTTVFNRWYTDKEILIRLDAASSGLQFRLWAAVPTASMQMAPVFMVNLIDETLE